MNTQYFCSNEKFIDSDLINLGKSFETPLRSSFGLSSRVGSSRSKKMKIFYCQQEQN